VKQAKAKANTKKLAKTFRVKLKDWVVKKGVSTTLVPLCIAVISFSLLRLPNTFLFVIGVSYLCCRLRVPPTEPKRCSLERVYVDAEWWLSLKGKQVEAIKYIYEVTIMMAGRRGLLQDRAKALELFSGFWVSIGDTKQAGYHIIVKVVELYKEWGAIAVA
jgi:hypothetical protein